MDRLPRSSIRLFVLCMVVSLAVFPIVWAASGPLQRQDAPSSGGGSPAVGSHDDDSATYPRSARRRADPLKLAAFDFGPPPLHSVPKGEDKKPARTTFSPPPVPSPTEPKKKETPSKVETPKVATPNEVEPRVAKAEVQSTTAANQPKIDVDRPIRALPPVDALEGNGESADQVRNWSPESESFAAQAIDYPTTGAERNQSEPPDGPVRTQDAQIAPTNRRQAFQIITPAPDRETQFDPEESFVPPTADVATPTGPAAGPALDEPKIDPPAVDKPTNTPFVIPGRTPPTVESTAPPRDTSWSPDEDFATTEQIKSFSAFREVEGQLPRSKPRVVEHPASKANSTPERPAANPAVTIDAPDALVAEPPKTLPVEQPAAAPPQDTTAAELRPEAPSRAAPMIDEPRPVAPLPHHVSPPPPYRLRPLPGPNPAMGAVSQRADEFVEHGISLASRGAPMAARVQFIQALRVVTQALDVQNGTHSHSQDLADAMAALREADDFMPRGSQLEANLDVPDIVAVHRTPALKDRDLANVTPLTALQQYYTLAQQKLTSACGGEPAAAHALYGLGKLYTALAGQSAESSRLNGPKAMVLHQAAVAVDPRNYRAANELGVMLARYGQLQDARAVLLHSLSVQQMPEAWHNLSVVHTRLGEIELAHRARYEWQLAIEQRTNGSGPAAGDGPAVRWVDAEEFARVSPRPAPTESRAAAPPSALSGPQSLTPDSHRSSKAWWEFWK